MNRPIAQVTVGAGGATASRQYYHANRQGSVIALTDDAGNLIAQHTYSPFGMPDTWSGNRIRYTGRWLDAETGLYYYRARFYSPIEGRFLQTDPVGYDDQMNMYAYVGNDPVNATDPSGEFFQAVAIGAAIGGGLSVASQMISSTNVSADFSSVGAAIDTVGQVAGALASNPGAALASVDMSVVVADAAAGTAVGGVGGKIVSSAITNLGKNAGRAAANARMSGESPGMHNLLHNIGAADVAASTGEAIGAVVGAVAGFTLNQTEQAQQAREAISEGLQSLSSDESNENDAARGSDADGVGVTHVDPDE